MLVEFIAKFVCVKTAGKALSWRITASSETMLLGYLMTGSWKTGAAIASVEVFSKFALYYAHERAWTVLPAFLTGAGGMKLAPVAA